MYMTPEEFDLDFDFDKEYGTTPDPGSNDDDDFDLDALLELGPEFYADFEKEFAASQAAQNAALNLADEPEDADEADEAEDDEDDSMEQTRFFGRFSYPDEDEEADEEAEDEADEDEPESLLDELDLDEDEIPVVPCYEDDEADEFEYEDEAESPRGNSKGLNLRAITDKVDWEAISEKIDLDGMKEKLAVAGGVIAENGARFVDALKDCKPGKMDKAQKRRFKNDVLPVLIGAAAFLLCMVFIFGAIGRGFTSEERQQAALQESIAQAEAERAAAALIENTLNTAAIQAAGYDYQAAINTLDSYKDAETGRELTDEMAAARAAYSAAMTELVVWDDPTAIVNLSFHVLIEDTARAYSDTGYGDSYRTKFISTAQFSAILTELHKNGYVLVNLDSCIAENTGADGKVTYTTKPIYLPADKTPIMITETLVNYFEYMTDGNGDGKPDAEGDGFASRLVVDAGEIKAEYIDASGMTHVGDYDLVPILNSFIDAHPDFTYHGAKAILAVTGSEGIFGWRTDKDATLTDGVKDIVEILRADGYQIACNSFANLDYSGRTSIAQINGDMEQWTAKITPIVGEVDIMVIAKGSAIKTRGGGFTAMEEAGYHYIIDCTDSPSAELTSEYFHQHRVMVTGEDLYSGAYDAYFVIDD